MVERRQQSTCNPESLGEVKLELSPRSGVLFERLKEAGVESEEVRVKNGTLHLYSRPLLPAARENPWRGRRTAGSGPPYHDWNERITAECYEPNTVS